MRKEAFAHVGRHGSDEGMQHNNFWFNYGTLAVTITALVVHHLV
ncbi:hypothetical protein ACFFGV_07460 [Pontibacillus salicampi]|uniref:Uncharacterized protein n=1 Tax=Pontibacillus salicampi TaxID=1449801 RepID=A0ABV6LLY8_9BACI